MSIFDKKIELDNIDIHNQIAIEKAVNREALRTSDCLNEYHYIRPQNECFQFLDKISYWSEQEKITFFTSFFWDQRVFDESIAANLFKFALRLEGFKDSNTLIETKELTLEERFNFINNIDYLFSILPDLSNRFERPHQSFSSIFTERIIEEDIRELGKQLYCSNWLNWKDVEHVLENAYMFIANHTLNEDLRLNLKEKQSKTKHKI